MIVAIKYANFCRDLFRNCDGICRDTEVQLREFENIACQKTEEVVVFFITLYLRLMFVVYETCGSNGENQTIKPGSPSLEDRQAYYAPAACQR